jgi:hypothetical protein
MDRARLDFERSLALHEAVAERLRREPQLVERARARLDEWLARGGRTTPLWLQWRDVLDRPLEEIVATMTSRSEDSAWLRKASPFAGILPPSVRLRILREVRRRLEAAA